MLYDFIQLDVSKNEPLYRQLYDSLQEAIASGRLQPGQRLVSIREAAAFLHVSKITVEEAYRHLCTDGYLQSQPKSGYVVRNQVPRRPQPPMRPTDSEEPAYQYDLGTGSVDTKASDIEIWQYHLRKVLARRKDILSYGAPQGELALRRELAQYAYTSRGVVADERQIVIGAGIQPLLSLLCGLLGTDGHVCLQRPILPQASQVFEDHGYTVSDFAPDSFDASGSVIMSDIVPEVPVSAEISVSFSPSTVPSMASSIVPPTTLRSVQSTASGGTSLCFAMPTLCDNDIDYRYGLLDWLEHHPEGLLIEDDYNGELHYATDSVPALQGQNPDQVIYVGSFSKLLLPSIRISYMVLPDHLLKRYASRLANYNQTASKIEQLALARYLHEGELERHLRKLRKRYRLKSKLMMQSLSDTFGDSLSMRLLESKLCISLKPHVSDMGVMSNSAVFPSNPYQGDEHLSLVRFLSLQALQAGIRILPASPRPDEDSLLAGFSGIDESDIPQAVEHLHEVWKPYLG